MSIKAQLASCFTWLGWVLLLLCVLANFPIAVLYNYWNIAIESNNFNANNTAGNATNTHADHIRQVLDMIAVIFWTTLGVITSIAFFFYYRAHHVTNTVWNPSQPFRWVPNDKCLRFFCFLMAICGLGMLASIIIGSTIYPPGPDAERRFYRRKYRLVYNVLGICPTWMFGIHTLGYLEALILERKKLNSNGTSWVLMGFQVPTWLVVWIYASSVIVAIWCLNYTLQLWTFQLSQEEWGLAVCPIGMLLLYAASVAHMNQKNVREFKELRHKRLADNATFAVSLLSNPVPNNDPLPQSPVPSPPNFDYYLIALHDPDILRLNLYTFCGFEVTWAKCAGTLATAIVVPGGVAALQYVWPKGS